MLTHGLCDFSSSIPSKDMLVALSLIGSMLLNTVKYVRENFSLAMIDANRGCVVGGVACGVGGNTGKIGLGSVAHYNVEEKTFASNSSIFTRGYSMTSNDLL